MAMNNKEQFKIWVLNNLTEKSGAGPAYISSIDWLSYKFYEKGRISMKSIFEIEDIGLITELHTEVKKIQRDKSSYIYNKDAPSYGERYFYSASLSKYKEFLLFKNGSSQSQSIKNEVKFKTEKFNISSFIEIVFESGLVFSETLITRFVSSLLTKPFLLLTGLSGSGKTKIAQSFVKWICEDESQYKIIPVGADWTNREPLLGYPNGLNATEYILPDSGALHIIIESAKPENRNKPYFLILDEMNLSHVERYFADFLSVMESNDKINLYSGNTRKDLDGSEVPNEIFWSKNLFIIGTVNIDETTYMFSPKVLDRANTIEFRLTEKDLADFIASDIKLDMELLKAQGANMSDGFMAMALQKTDKNLKPTEADLKLFFSELKKSGAEFGYRTASEIGRLMYMLKELGESGDNLLDIAIMQKLLPKLHGSRNKLTKVLPILGGFCLTDNSKIKEDYLDKFLSNSLTEVELKADSNIKYKISFEKICRMYKNAVENGFASYAEA
jgi:5-methylcytosine-specific restriction enzyme B